MRGPRRADSGNAQPLGWGATHARAGEHAPRACAAHGRTSGTTSAPQPGRAHWPAVREGATPPAVTAHPEHPSQSPGDQQTPASAQRGPSYEPSRARPTCSTCGLSRNPPPRLLRPAGRATDSGGGGTHSCQVQTRLPGRQTHHGFRHQGVQWTRLYTAPRNPKAASESIAMLGHASHVPRSPGGQC